MNKSGFFPKLALQSIRKNGKLYFPYFLTCIGTSAMFYIMLFLAGSNAFLGRRGANSVPVVLSLGCVVIAIFSTIILFYTNSFLIKRRQRELGLYNILGMEKKHIARIMLWETIYTAVVGIVGGILVGILFSKLALLLLCKLINFDIFFGFYISVSGIFATIIVFCVIFLLNLIVNLIRVGKAKPIELLHSGNVGEREPKSKWIITLIGVVALAAGYTIAIVITEPLKALGMFFVAVILVIIGTYCLFISGSIFILKLLRKNKKYYYKARHFTSVSGMFYRMKRNAAGLASICILCTMVLVTVSSTLCLFLGANDMLSARYPYDFIFSFRNPDDQIVEDTVNYIKNYATENGCEITEPTLFKSLEVTLCAKNNSTLDFSDDGSYSYNISDDQSVICYFITDSEYSDLTGQDVTLEPGEILSESNADTFSPAGSVTIGGLSFAVSSIEDFPATGAVTSYVARTVYFVVCEEDLYKLNDVVIENIDNSYTAVEVQIRFNAAGELVDNTEAQIELYNGITDSIWDSVISADSYSDTDGHRYFSYSASARANDADEFESMYGGFFFLGIFLGFLFLMATVLIIYYKQISEGYEDAKGFQIMQKVGMSEKEVRSSIKSQILIVFFLPLVMAGVHVAAAFKMITRMLAVFSLHNTQLFALCCLGTLLAFAVVYAIIYAFTARAYYRIVHS